MFHCGSLLVFHHFVVTRRCRCLLQSVWVLFYAMMAALCDLGDPGWGDPWFPH